MLQCLMQKKCQINLIKSIRLCISGITHEIPLQCCYKLNLIGQQNLFEFPKLLSLLNLIGQQNLFQFPKFLSLLK